MSALPEPPAVEGQLTPDQARWFIALGILFLAAVMIFSGLGRHALWDDEAMDALSAEGVLQTGDTTAVLDHNIVAYRSGLLLVKMRHQAMPPVPAYLAAGSFSLFGLNAWASRLPFALCGLGTVWLLVWWGLRSRVAPWIMGLLGLAILGNVQLLLYFRNTHYYGPAILLIVGIGYCYLHHLGSPKGQWLMAGLSGVLVMTNYTWLVVLYCCLALDYLLWRRREVALRWPDLLRIFAPQVPFGLAMVVWWNPLTTQLGGYVSRSSPLDRVSLFFWNWRDLDRCEYLSLPMLGAALWLAIKGNRPLARALTALAVFVVVMSALSTQIVKETSVADVRYLAGALPLCIAISVLTILAFFGRRPILALVVAAIVFGTNLLNGGPFLSWGVRSTFFSFLSELAGPYADPYTPAAKWIEDNVPEGASIWVEPDYMAYPLIFHAPKAIYAWQLANEEKQPQFANLPPIHFQGRVAPDYVMTFGPVVQSVIRNLEQWNKAKYEHIATLDAYWHDMYRPELLWHSFTPIYSYNHDLEVIHVFKRVP